MRISTLEKFTLRFVLCLFHRGDAVKSTGMRGDGRPEVRSHVCTFLVSAPQILNSALLVFVESDSRQVYGYFLTALIASVEYGHILDLGLRIISTPYYLVVMTAHLTIVYAMVMYIYGALVRQQVVGELIVLS